MFNIAEYLQKFAHLEGDSKFREDMIRKALKDVCDLQDIEFEMKKGTLYLKTNPLVKSIVFMKKEKLVEYLKNNLPKARVLDVR